MPTSCAPSMKRRGFRFCSQAPKQGMALPSCGSVFPASCLPLQAIPALENRACSIALDPRFSVQVGEVSQAARTPGRHTTRHVELYTLSGGAEIIDTPGFSSFDTDELGFALKERLPETFLDFAPYLDGCRFVGCSHTKEKGCAVLEAVRAGKLSASRHASYLRLYNELKDLREWSSK